MLLKGYLNLPAEGANEVTKNKASVDQFYKFKLLHIALNKCSTSFFQSCVQCMTFVLHRFWYLDRKNPYLDEVNWLAKFEYCLYKNSLNYYFSLLPYVLLITLSSWISKDVWKTGFSEILNVQFTKNAYFIHNQYKRI